MDKKRNQLNIESQKEHLEGVQWSKGDSGKNSKE